MPFFLPPIGDKKTPIVKMHLVQRNGKVMVQAFIHCLHQTPASTVVFDLDGNLVTPISVENWESRGLSLGIVAYYDIDSLPFYSMHRWTTVVVVIEKWFYEDGVFKHEFVYDDHGGFKKLIKKLKKDKIEGITKEMVKVPMESLLKDCYACQMIGRQELVLVR